MTQKMREWKVLSGTCDLERTTIIKRYCLCHVFASKEEKDRLILVLNIYKVPFFQCKFEIYEKKDISYES